MKILFPTPAFLYRVQDPWRLEKKKKTIKPIVQSQTAGYPISLSTSTIGLFLGSVLWYHVAILNCPRKLAALLQLKIPSPPEAEQHTPLIPGSLSAFPSTQDGIRTGLKLGSWQIMWKAMNHAQQDCLNHMYMYTAHTSLTQPKKASVSLIKMRERCQTRFLGNSD